MVLNLILRTRIRHLSHTLRVSLAVDNGDMRFGGHTTGSLGQNSAIHFGSSIADCVLYKTHQMRLVNNMRTALASIV